MIRFSALGVRFSLPLLSLLAPLLAARLGMRGGMAGLGISLCLHELGHLLAAKLAGVEIREIRILPFGGSARMENPYGLSPIHLAIVAAAGPLVNLLLAIFAAALAQWRLLDGKSAAEIAGMSITLMLFNLLPALPLDGGRMLYALLQGRLGRERALKLGIWLGRVLAGLLLLGALLLRLRSGKWNLSFVLAAVFILSSERDERDALAHSRAEMLGRMLKDTPEPRPARIYQLDGETTAAEALRLLRPRESAWFVLTRNGRPMGMIDSGTLIREVLNRGNDFPLWRLMRYTLTQKTDCC